MIGWTNDRLMGGGAKFINVRNQWACGAYGCFVLVVQVARGGRVLLFSLHMFAKLAVLAGCARNAVQDSPHVHFLDECIVFVGMKEA